MFRPLEQMYAYMRVLCLLYRFKNSQSMAVVVPLSACCQKKSKIKKQDVIPS